MVPVFRKEDADEHAEHLYTVCRLRGRQVPIEECIVCRYGDGLYLDPRDGESLAACLYSGSDPSSEEGCRLWTRAMVKPTDAVKTETPVSEVMTRDVVDVTRDTSIETLASILLDRGISGAPVVDAERRPIGMVSKTDLLERGTKHTVGEIMTDMIFTLPEDAPVAQAAALMAFEGVHRLVVVDGSGAVLGLVSTLDVMRWLARTGGYGMPPYDGPG